ncbi:MAG: glycosyl hydrolase family 28 protein [Alloprevotella sp.]
MKPSFSVRFIVLILLSVCAFVTVRGAGRPSLSIYSFTPTRGLQPNETYSVSVRSTAGGEWQTVPVWNCEVDMHRRSVAAFAQFDTDGGVEVRVKLLNPAVLEADSLAPVVRPANAAANVSLSEDGTLLHFTLPKPEYVSVEFGGDRHHNLHLFANPMLQETYNGDEADCINWNGGGKQQDVFVKDAKLIYFAPGVHRPKDLPGEDIRIPSNCTVFLAPGSVVQARLIVDHAENVRIIGRGILDHPLRGIEVTHSKNVLIDGITVLNPRHYTVFGGASSHVTIRNLKSFSAGSWTDGIDMMSCHHVDVENVFLRTSDDCLAFYGHRWWYWGDAHDINVKRATLWCDFAHPVNIGTHGDDRCEEGEELHHISISDCHILRNNGDGMLAINCGDKNRIHHVTFDRIHMEAIERGRITDLRVIHGAYNRAPGGFIDQIVFSNIFVDEQSASHILPSRIYDYNSEHGVRDYSFKNVRYGLRLHNCATDEDRRTCEE